MEVLQWVIASFSILLLIAALIVFLRHSVFGLILTNCCNQLCNGASQQDSHLDIYNLKVHYKSYKDNSEVVIENLPGSGLSNPAFSGASRDLEPVTREVILTPLPSSLRSQCPSSSCSITLPE